MIAVIAVLALVAAVKDPADGSPSVHALVERCVSAYGGPRALARAARVREVGTVTSLLHPGVVGRIGRAWSRPGRLRIEVDFPAEPGELRVLSGDRGWRGGQEVSGPYLDSMRLQAARLDLPALLRERERDLVDRGTQSMDGRKVRVLALAIGPSLMVEAWLDPATGRILRSRSAGSGGGPLEFVTTYEDHRVVDGVLVAFREVNWANGRTTGETVLQEVSFPAELSDDLFGP